MNYTQSEWILLFYMYCMIGWVWESLFVSVRKRKFINRGFLYGPWLPIYGSGAIIILWVTRPLQTSIVLIFFCGMLSATLLEFVTGFVMEKVFQMRYWDYSDMPLNVNGYICLPVSFAWGAFSVLLVKCIHPPIHQVICWIPHAVVEFASFLLTILFVADATKSILAALDLKELMVKLSNRKRIFKDADMRLRDIIAQLHPERMEDEVQEKKSKRKRIFAILEERSGMALQDIQVQLEHVSSESEKSRLQTMRQNLLDFQESVRKAEWELAVRKDSQFRRAANILKRNPNATSRRHQEAIDELNEFNSKSKDGDEETM